MEFKEKDHCSNVNPRKRPLSGGFQEAVYWRRFCVVDLSKLHAMINVLGWAESKFDNEANNGGASYAQITIKKMPQSFCDNFVWKPTSELNFKIFRNGKIVGWQADCNRFLADFFNNFFIKIVFWCLVEKGSE